jgi:hypothetical protein
MTSKGPPVAKSSRTSGPDPAAILDGLRKALSGQKPLLGKGDCLFPDTVKGRPLAQAAVDQGYLITRTETVPPSGRKKGKEVVIGELTEKGRQYVLEVESPKEVLQALLPAVQTLAEGHTQQSKSDTLRPELEKATQACVKAIEGAFAKLQKTVETAFAKLQETVVKALPAPFAKLEEAVVKVLPAPAPKPFLDPGPVLSALQAALTRVAVPSGSTPSVPSQSAPPTHQSSAVEEAAPKPITTPAPVVESGQLREAIRQAYDHLCLFVEFRDKLVEIPRLYHETVRRSPDVTLERFHRELEALSDERKVELHKLNEVHMAKERDLAIEKDDRLYYYVFWK